MIAGFPTRFDLVSIVRFIYLIFIDIKAIFFMKNILILSTFLFIATTYSEKAQAQNVAKSLCEYVSADDKSRLRSYLKSHKLKIRNVFDGVQCNGQNLVAFASTNNAIKTGTLMLGKLPKATVEDLLATITSPELTAAAKQRING